jgi:hypothetical protein
MMARERKANPVAVDLFLNLAFRETEPDIQLHVKPSLWR